MNTNPKSIVLRLTAFLTPLLLLAATTWADVKGIGGDEPRPTDSTSNAPFIAWTILVVFSLGILAISFKTSRRNSAQRSA